MFFRFLKLLPRLRKPVGYSSWALLLISAISSSFSIKISSPETYVLWRSFSNYWQQLKCNRVVCEEQIYIRHQFVHFMAAMTSIAANILSSLQVLLVSSLVLPSCRAKLSGRCGRVPGDWYRWIGYRKAVGGIGQITRVRKWNGISSLFSFSLLVQKHRYLLLHCYSVCTLCVQD